MALAAGAIGSLVAPVAVRVLDLDAPLDDLDLSHQYRRDYRSVLAVVRLAQDPIGVATFPVAPGGCVTRAELACGLSRQLAPEVYEAFVRLDRAREERSGAAPPLAFADPPPRIGPSPSVSVVVATGGNPNGLEHCLRSILSCRYDDLEVLVVERKGGLPNTARMLVARFPGEPRLRYLEAPGGGVSRARNVGLSEAEGEIVAFIDDQVMVDQLWLRACVEALDGPGVGCVTGLVLPQELETESHLLLEHLDGCGRGFQPRVYRLPGVFKADPFFPREGGPGPSGAGMVMLTEVARELGGFDPALGPGTLARGGDELDLLVRLLRSGQAVSYEPRAIVWHAAPDGIRPRPRRVYRAAVGVGAMLGKQLIATPRRRELVRAMPVGLRYLRARARHHTAATPARYPRLLSWLERLGMLVGPVVYVVSALIAAARRLATAPAPSPRPLRIVRRMVISGEPVSVVSFRAAEAARLRFGWRRDAEAIAAGPPVPLVLGAAATCVTAPLLVALDAPAAARTPAVLAFLCLIPGIAWLSATRGRAETGLVLGISGGLVAVAVQSMLWLGVWSPRELLWALAAVCMLPLSWRLRRAWPRDRSVTAMRRWPRPAIARATAVHIGVITGALALWATSLIFADLNRIDGLGLLPALPVTYYVGLSLVLAGFAVAVSRASLNRNVLGAYVLALIILIFATTPLLYHEPRYAWVFKHLGVINLIGATGGVNRQIDIYNNWPSFFALNAWFSRTSGLAPIGYAAWAQVFFNLFNLFAMRFALRALTRDERILWTAGLFFVLGNWVGQDYLAPQAFGFALALVVLGLCLRCGRKVEPAHYWPGRWITSALSRIAGPVLPDRGHDDSSPMGPRSAALAGAACVVAVVTAHQLSPVMLTLSVLLLALVTRRIPLWVPAAMAVIEVWWVALAWPFVHAHFNLVDPGGTGTAAPGRNLAAALPGARLSLFAPALVMAFVVVLAGVGLVRRLNQGKHDLAAACLIIAPVAVVAVQSYGGEGPYRAYLFALPWLAFLAAFACTRRRTSPERARMSLPGLLSVAPVVAVCLLVAFFGQELANRVTPDEVRASAWYERNAPAGSMRIDLAPNSPDRLTARYPLVSLSDPPSLVEERGFTGHRLGRADVPRLLALIQRQRARPAYVVLSRLQENYARLNGLLPNGSLAGFVAALGRSPAFRLVYRRPTAWIFEYPAPTSSQPRPTEPQQWLH